MSTEEPVKALLKCLPCFKLLCYTAFTGVHYKFQHCKPIFPRDGLFGMLGDSGLSEILGTVFFSVEVFFFFFPPRCRSPKLVICVSTCVCERVIPKPSSTKDSVPNRDFEFEEMCNILYKPPPFSQMLRSCIFGMWQCPLQALLSLLTLISQDFTAALWSSWAQTEGINYPRLAPRWVLALKGRHNGKGWLELT